MKQCVPIKVVGATSSARKLLSDVNEVGGLAARMQAAHTKCCATGDPAARLCLLLTAPPAAGKTCLMSQLVMHALADESSLNIPILVKVQQLHR